MTDLSSLTLRPSTIDAFVARAPSRSPVAEGLHALRPVHVVYGGAHLFDVGSPAKLGERARSAMAIWGTDPLAFGALFGIVDRDVAEELHGRVTAKLLTRPVEALCIDFEDGYGPRPDDEEDDEAIRTATALRALGVRGEDPPQIGIRIKALEASTIRRGLVTLDRFLTAMGASPPPHFSVTLPKVRRPEEVTLLVDVLEELETALGLAPIRIELMVESPRALVAADGTLALAALVRAGAGRIVCLHLGAYDLTAELGVTAGDQRLDHPFCDLARWLLQLGLAGSDIGVADGATTLLPIGTKGHSVELSTPAIHDAWRLHARNVARAIDVGIWQGWDLHPAQLPARYGALYAHFLIHREAMAKRLAAFVAKATHASRVGQVFDDAATGQGLVTFFARGLACGALSEHDLASTTLTRAELAGRSFLDIAQARAR